MTYALINLFAWLVLAHFGALAADRLHPAHAQDAMHCASRAALVMAMVSAWHLVGRGG